MQLECKRLGAALVARAQPLAVGLRPLQRGRQVPRMDLQQQQHSSEILCPADKCNTMMGQIRGSAATSASPGAEKDLRKQAQLDRGATGAALSMSANHGTRKVIQRQHSPEPAHQGT